MLMCLPLLMAGCSNDDDKEVVKPDDPDIPGENASDYIEFKGSLLPMTRSVVEEDAVQEAVLYAWGKNVSTQNYILTVDGFKTSVTGMTDCLLFGAESEYELKPEAVTLKRDSSDPTVWDYSPKFSWKKENGNNLSFFAIAQPRDTKAPVFFREAKAPHIFGREVEPAEHDELNDEYYYASGDLSDAMVAYTYNCTTAEYANRKEVELTFRHLFPRVVLNAKLGEKNALEVNVNEAYIYGLSVNGTHKTDTQESFDEGWTTMLSPLSQYIQMDLSQPVKLTSELQPLVDKNKEAHVIPQKVKPWSSYSSQNGAGIILSVNIRNLHDKSWIVGREGEYELVYLPFPLEQLESGRLYNIDLVFGTMYRDNGSAFGYQLSYKPEIVDWDTDTENIELKK